MKELDFNHCVVVINPGSTHYARGLRMVGQIQDQFPANKVTVIEVSEAEYRNGEKLATKLHGQLSGKTLLVIAAGDGTVSLVINLLLSSPLLTGAGKDAVILPLWGGNANDLAYMVNGAVSKASIVDIIQNGRIVSIQPLAVTVEHGSHKATSLAVCYASFGASANAARNVSRPAHRHRSIYQITGTRMLTDMASITRSVIGSKPFLSEFNGKLQPLFDLILINGSRIAKVNRVGPGNITEPTFYVIKMHRKHPVIGLYLARIARGAAFRHATQTELEFTVRQSTWAQLDGEARLIEADSKVSIKPNRQPFYVLSTKL